MGSAMRCRRSAAAELSRSLFCVSCSFSFQDISYQEKFYVAEVLAFSSSRLGVTGRLWAGSPWDDVSEVFGPFLFFSSEAMVDGWP